MKKRELRERIEDLEEISNLQVKSNDGLLQRMAVLEESRAVHVDLIYGLMRRTLELENRVDELQEMSILQVNCNNGLIRRVKELEEARLYQINNNAGFLQRIIALEEAKAKPNHVTPEHFTREEHRQPDFGDE